MIKEGRKETVLHFIGCVWSKSHTAWLVKPCSCRQKQSSGEVYSTEICLAVPRASYHNATYVNNCRGPQHFSIGATWFSWFLSLGSEAQKSSSSSAKYTINIPTCRKQRLECWAHNHQSGDQGKQRKVTRKEHKLGELKCYHVPVTSVKDSNTCREES